MQTVTVFSDYICPFCFIGKRRADKLAEELAVQPVWKGYEIHPEVPPEGIPLSRFAPEMISGLEARVGALAEEIGLEMRMPELLSNSRLALLGGEFAREAGKAHEYHEAVFRAYFQEGKDIGNINVLVEIAGATALDGMFFKKAIESAENAHLLDASLNEARSLGLTGVPSFVFANGDVVIGAQPYDILKKTAEKSLANS